MNAIHNRANRDMHELPVTESILRIVLRHALPGNVNRIVRIFLEIGELSELENEWIQHYFDYLSKGTVAENAKLVINRIPIVLQCNECSNAFEIKREAMKNIQCPECGNTKYRLVSGRSYYIKNMEVI